ncbi:MAG: winged helix-turn-helix transcriptional regulator [Candidatus Bathyarchaeia archaeon]
MNLQKISLALILSFVIVVSLVAVIQLEKNNSLSFSPNVPFTSNLAGHATFETTFVATTNNISSQAALEDTNSTRAEVYNFIDANPGIQFRGICAGLDIAIGTAEFHLGVLKKAGLISFIRDGKYKRFFVTKKFSLREMKLISLLRHETLRKILKRITDETTVSHHELASQLSITSQGLTWQMNKLRKEGIIQGSIDGIKVTYTLNETCLPMLTDLLCIMKE